MEHSNGRNGVANMLDLSTSHMPASSPDWGDLRVAEHEHGWVVFVPGGLDDEEFEELVPEWARPVMRYALDFDCILINFDQDSEVVEGLPTWEWGC